MDSKDSMDGMDGMSGMNSMNSMDNMDREKEENFQGGECSIFLPEGFMWLSKREGEGAEDCM